MPIALRRALWQNNFMSRWIKFFIAILVGLGLGLLYGWVISPVEYVDTTPDTLNQSYRTDYVLMVAEVYETEFNVELAARRLALLGSQHPLEIANTALTFARQSGYGDYDLKRIQDLIAGLRTWQPASGDSP